MVRARRNDIDGKGDDSNGFTQRVMDFTENLGVQSVHRTNAPSGGRTGVLLLVAGGATRLDLGGLGLGRLWGGFLSGGLFCFGHMIG